MLDRHDPVIRELNQLGFRVAAHSYLRTGQSKFLVQATHKAAGTFSGRSNRNIDDALLKMERALANAGLWLAEDY